MEQTPSTPGQVINPAVQEQNQIKEFFAAPSVLKKFQDLLGSRAQGFVTTILQVTSSNNALRACLPKSIFTAAAVAATMDLPVNQNLGFAWLVPFKGLAQFQIGYKGYVQLAMRTGQYLRLNVIEVYENQFTSWNELTEELVADFSKDGTGKVVGYCSYFKLINGFEKTIYWTMKKVVDHATKYSQSYKSGNASVWKDDFNGMAKKTVLKSILSKWGILSIEMQKAIVVDQAVINDAEGTDFTYIDSIEEEQQTPKKKADKAIEQAVDMLQGKRK